MKIKKITWNILPVDTLKCMCCRADIATLRASIPWVNTTINFCLCAECAKKPEDKIIEEVLKNG